MSLANSESWRKGEAHTSVSSFSGTLVLSLHPPAPMLNPILRGKCSMDHTDKYRPTTILIFYLILINSILKKKFNFKFYSNLNPYILVMYLFKSYRIFEIACKILWKLVESLWTTFFANISEIFLSSLLCSSILHPTPSNFSLLHQLHDFILRICKFPFSKHIPNSLQWKNSRLVKKCTYCHRNPFKITNLAIL